MDFPVISDSVRFERLQPPTDKTRMVIDTDTYNERALLAQERMRTVFDENFFLIDKGREVGEKAIVLVEEGTFRGFGFIHEEEVGTPDDLRNAIKSYPGNPETARIIQRFMSDNPKMRILPL